MKEQEEQTIPNMKCNPKKDIIILISVLIKKWGERNSYPGVQGKHKALINKIFKEQKNIMRNTEIS